MIDPDNATLAMLSNLMIPHSQAEETLIGLNSRAGFPNIEYYPKSHEDYNSREAKAVATALDGQLTANEIHSEIGGIKVGSDIQNGIPTWAQWAFKGRWNRPQQGANIGTLPSNTM